MPVGVNTGANKLDAFLRRSVHWRVRLSPDGAAQATAALTLANDSPAYGLPRYITGLFDDRFRPGQNEQFATLGGPWAPRAGPIPVPSPPRPGPRAAEGRTRRPGRSGIRVGRAGAGRRPGSRP
jgi:hypothetical protein